MAASARVWMNNAGLCDLKSRKRPAYLFVWHREARFLIWNRAGKAFLGNGGFCARRGRLRTRPRGLGRPDRAGIGIWRIARLYLAVDPGLGGPRGHRGADRS